MVFVLASSRSQVSVYFGDEHTRESLDWMTLGGSGVDFVRFVPFIRSIPFAIINDAVNVKRTQVTLW